MINLLAGRLGLSDTKNKYFKGFVLPRGTRPT